MISLDRVLCLRGLCSDHGTHLILFVSFLAFWISSCCFDMQLTQVISIVPIRYEFVFYILYYTKMLLLYISEYAHKVHLLGLDSSSRLIVSSYGLCLGLWLPFSSYQSNSALLVCKSQDSCCIAHRFPHFYITSSFLSQATFYCTVVHLFHLSTIQYLQRVSICRQAFQDQPISDTFC